MIRKINKLFYESNDYDVADNLYKDPMKQALADYLADTIINNGVIATDVQDAAEYLENKGFYVDFQFEDIQGEWEAFEKYIKVLVDGWCKNIITYDKDKNGKYIKRESIQRMKEDSWDDVVRSEIKKRYIWPLYADANYEIVDIINRYKNMSRFKGELKGFNLKDITYMDYDALELELNCSYEVYSLIRKELEKEGLYMDDEDYVTEALSSSSDYFTIYGNIVFYVYSDPKNKEFEVEDTDYNLETDDVETGIGDTYISNNRTDIIIELQDDVRKKLASYEAGEYTVTVNIKATVGYDADEDVNSISYSDIEFEDIDITCE